MKSGKRYRDQIHSIPVLKMRGFTINIKIFINYDYLNYRKNIGNKKKTTEWLYLLTLGLVRGFRYCVVRGEQKQTLKRKEGKVQQAVWNGKTSFIWKF